MHWRTKEKQEELASVVGVWSIVAILWGLVAVLVKSLFVTWSC